MVSAGIVIKDGLDQMDFERVHSWLVEARWSTGVSRERVERAAKHSSMVIGAFDGPMQVGYTRIVSDRTTFGYVCDVFVDQDYRGQGIGREMVRHALEDVEHQGLRRWCLVTWDAHGVYKQLGFEELPDAWRWMVIYDLDKR